MLNVDMLNACEQASCRRPPARIHPPTCPKPESRVGVCGFASEQQYVHLHCLLTPTAPSEASKLSYARQFTRADIPTA